MWHSWRLNRVAECEDHLLSDSAYLQHNRADVSYTLSDGLWSAGDCDSPLRRVRQHVSCHLNLSACGLNISRQQKKQRLFIAEKGTPSHKLKCCFKHPQITPNTFWHAGSSCKPNSKCVLQYLKRRTQILSIQNEYSACTDLYRHNQWDFHEQQPQKDTHILRHRKTRQVCLECLILEVSVHQGGCFPSLFGCKNTTSW